MFSGKKNTFYITYAGKSDIGLTRQENQDSYAKLPEDSLDIYNPKGIMFIVADGMGGHESGKVASELAIQEIEKSYYQNNELNINQSLIKALKEANCIIYNKAHEEQQIHQMGTTCSVLLILNDFAYIAHVGDSRIYHIHENKIEQLTDDHSQVAELLRRNVINEEDALNHPGRFILSRAIGVKSEVEVDVTSEIPLQDKDYYMLCSDGLGNIDINKIKDVIISKSVSEACNNLIETSKQLGGEDNITVQIIRINQENRNYFENNNLGIKNIFNK